MSDHLHNQSAIPLIKPASETAGVMQKACNRFMESLTAELRKKAHFSFNSNQRRRWHYVPREMFDRKGVCLKEMNIAQRRAAYAMHPHPAIKANPPSGVILPSHFSPLIHTFAKPQNEVPKAIR
jgi:hypothetical protein